MPTAIYGGNPQIGATGRPQPQTTQQASGGPFIRHARPASRIGYVTGALSPTTGAAITNPLVAAPGYLRRLDLTFSASGGAINGTTAVYADDAPFSQVSFLTMKDPWGTPLFSGPGYDLLYLIPKLSGQIGAVNPWALDMKALPSSIGGGSLTGAAATANAGNFRFRSYLPLEAAKGYGTISIGNASVLPTLQMNLASAASALFTTNPGTQITGQTVTCDEAYYDVDPASPVEPPGLGTALQWIEVQGNQSPTSAGLNRIQLPRVGGYLTTLILILRDSAGNRLGTVTNGGADAFNGTGRLRFYIDGVPYLDETYLEGVDRLCIEAGITGSGTLVATGTRANENPSYANPGPGPNPLPFGVFGYTFKNSYSQQNLGLLDTLETAMLTNPGTLLEIENTWGTITGGPAALFALIGQLVPSGPIQQGFIEA